MKGICDSDLLGLRDLIGSPQSRDLASTGKASDIASKLLLSPADLVRLTRMVMPKLQATSDDDAEIEAARSARDKRRELTLLMARHGDAIYRFAVAMTRDRDLADEVRQQVFVDVFRDLDNLAAGSSLQGWVFGIARNRCLDAVTARKRWHERYKNAPPEEPQHEDCKPDLDRGRLARILVACLAKLAPAAREAVVLRYQQELSYDEVATVTGDGPATIRQRVVRALPLLRRCVERHLHRGEPR